MTRPTRYPLWKALLIPWLFQLVLFRPVFTGNVPLNMNWAANHFVPWNLSAHPQVKNPEIDDPILQHYPLAVLAAQSWRHGLIPLWNPNIACGMPLAADTHSLPFDPLFLLTFLLVSGPFHAWAALLMLQQFVLTFALAGFLRSRGCSLFGNAMGALALSFSGAVITWCEMRLFTGALIGMLLSLWAVEVRVRTGNRSGALGIGLGLALSVLSGHLQFVFYAWILVLGYLLYRSRGSGGKLIQIVKVSGASVFWGVLFSAPAWLPLLELITRTMRGVPGRYFPLFRFGISSLMTLICPDFLGHPAGHNYVGLALYQKSYMNLPILYIGIVPLMFALVAFQTFRQRKRFWTISAALLITGLTILGIPAVKQLVYKVFPGVFGMDPGRSAAFICLMLAIIAADGYTEFETDRTSGRSLHFLIIIPLIFSAAVLILSLMLKFAVVPAADPEAAPGLLNYFRLLTRRYGAVFLFPSVLSLLIYILCYALIMWLYQSGRIRRTLFIPLIFFLTGADLLPFGMRYLEFNDPNVLKQAEEYLTCIPDSGPAGGRVCGIDPPDARNFAGMVLPPNTGALAGQYSFRGYVSVYVERFARMMNAIQRRTYYDRRLRVASSPWYDLAGVRWFVFFRPVTVPDLKLTANSPGFFVYENKNAYPKAWIVNKIDSHYDPDQQCTAITQGKADIRNTGYLDPQNHLMIHSGESAFQNSVQLISSTRHSLTFNVFCDGGGMLIINDVWYPGWKAEVNGKIQKILRADYLFRGVLLQSGAAVVRVFYYPESFLLGFFGLLIGMFFAAMKIGIHGGFS